MAQTGQSNVVDVPEHRLRFHVDSPWEARLYPDGMEAEGLVTYRLTDPTTGVPPLAEEFLITILPPGRDVGIDLTTSSVDARLAKLQQLVPFSTEFLQGTEVARTRTIGGTTGMEVYGATGSLMSFGALARFEDGTVLLILGGAELQVLSSEDQVQVFEGLLDSIERY